MQILTQNPRLSAVISGLLTCYAICHIDFTSTWFCYIPLFVCIYNQSAKQAFKTAFIFGLAFSSFAFYWMIPGAERFTGNSVLYGVGIFIISAIFYASFCAVLLYCFAKLKKNDNDVRAIIINSSIVSSLFCIGEALLGWISSGFPWFDVHSGNGLAENLYTIQPASLFGMHILTFVSVTVNYLIAILAIRKLWVKLYVPVVTAMVYFFAGFFLLYNFKKNLPDNKSFDVAILAENIPPEIVWDNTTGNMLVQELLDLNHHAVRLKPGMTLWSESAIPWTYKQDDDLIKEVFRITDPAKVTHILGINTEHKQNEVFNSAYCILPGRVVAGRYDKQHLLTFIEKPLNGWLMPFISSNGYSALNDPDHNHPLTTPYGKAGLLICNEAALPVAAANQVKQGAEFLMNMSNDGWFNDTYIVRIHYYYARLRAVESRRDIAINCNNGFSGLIKASGSIEVKEKSNEPFVKMVSIQPNNYITMATAYPDVFFYCCATYIIILAVYHLLRNHLAKRRFATGEMF